VLLLQTADAYEASEVVSRLAWLLPQVTLIFVPAPSSNVRLVTRFLSERYRRGEQQVLLWWQQVEREGKRRAAHVTRQERRAAKLRSELTRKAAAAGTTADAAVEAVEAAIAAAAAAGAACVAGAGAPVQPQQQLITSPASAAPPQQLAVLAAGASLPAQYGAPALSQRPRAQQLPERDFLSLSLLAGRTASGSLWRIVRPSASAMLHPCHGPAGAGAGAGVGAAQPLGPQQQAVWLVDPSLSSAAVVGQPVTAQQDPLVAPLEATVAAADRAVALLSTAIATVQPAHRRGFGWFRSKPRAATRAAATPASGRAVSVAATPTIGAAVAATPQDQTPGAATPSFMGPAGAGEAPLGPAELMAAGLLPTQPAAGAGDDSDEEDGASVRYDANVPPPLAPHQLGAFNWLASAVAELRDSFGVTVMVVNPPPW
jgi:nucleoid DNA-binding protein